MKYALLLVLLVGCAQQPREFNMVCSMKIAKELPDSTYITWNSCQEVK